MANSYLMCPQCNSSTYYIETDDGLVFFEVTEDGKPSLKPGDPDPATLDFSRINCTACAWYGSLEELVTYHKK